MDQGQDTVLKSYCVFKLYLVRIPGWKDLRTEDGELYKPVSVAFFCFFYASLPIKGGVKQSFLFENKFNSVIFHNV